MIKDCKTEYSEPIRVFLPMPLINPRPVPAQICMPTASRGLHRAAGLSWLECDSEQDNAPFDIEKVFNYVSKANGNIHTLVPGKLLFFVSPHPLPDNQAWIDVRDAGGWQERRFSADYLADHLVDLDVSVVACLSVCCIGDTAAFAARDLDVYDLRLDPRRPSMLCAM